MLNISGWQTLKKGSMNVWSVHWMTSIVHLEALPLPKVWAENLSTDWEEDWVGCKILLDTWRRKPGKRLNYSVILRRVRPTCCCRKAINISYYECVFVALGIQHATHMRHVVICSLPHSTIFFHITSQPAQLKKNWKPKVCFYFLSKFCPKVSHSKKRLARYD